MVALSDIQQAKQRFGIIGNTPGLLRAVSRALQIAPTDLSVLITGGKSMLLAVFTNRAIVRKPLLLLLTAERSRKTWPHPNFSGM